MTYRIKNLHDATKRMFNAKGFNYPKLDRDSDRNDAIITRLFNDTMTGIIKGFYLIDETDFRAYHRSPKRDVYIQLSYGFYRNGDLIPCGDVQLESARDLLREGVRSGHYKIID